jgi:hypothetical protein
MCEMFSKWECMEMPDGSVEVDCMAHVCTHPSRSGECTISCPFRSLMDLEHKEESDAMWRHACDNF